MIEKGKEERVDDLVYLLATATPSELVGGKVVLAEEELTFMGVDLEDAFRRVDPEWLNNRLQQGEKR